MKLNIPEIDLICLNCEQKANIEIAQSQEYDKHIFIVVYCTDCKIQGVQQYVAER